MFRSRRGIVIHLAGRPVLPLDRVDDVSLWLSITVGGEINIHCSITIDPSLHFTFNLKQNSVNITILVNHFSNLPISLVWNIKHV